MARRKKDEIIEAVDTKKVETEKIVIPRKEVLKKVSKTTEVVVQNNTIGRVIFKANNGEELDIKYGGDTTILSCEALMEIKNKSKDLLSKFYIIPIEVLDEGVSLEEVIVFLGLDNIYNKNNIKMEAYMEAIINSKPELFHKYMETLDEAMVKRIAEKITDLYLDGEFDSSRKQQLLEERLSNPHLFEDLKTNNK